MPSRGWDRARRLRYGLVVLGLACGAGGACVPAARQAARGRLQLVPQPDRLLGENLIDAERVVAGRLADVDEAVEYERLGGLFVGLFGDTAVAPLAYTARIQVDSTLLGRPSGTLWVTFFAPRGVRTPVAGTTAIWVLHRRVLWRLKRCAEQQSFTSTACPYDIGLALDSDDDIRPSDEWLRIRAILRALRLGSGPVN